MEIEEYSISTRLPNKEKYTIRYEEGHELEVIDEIIEQFNKGRLGLSRENVEILVWQMGIIKAKRLKENLLSAR